VRSVTLTAALMLIGRRAAIAKAVRSRQKWQMLLRAPVILAAWICYYNAARHLGLAELTTLYYAAPIMVVVLSIILLKEKVHAARWAAVGIGFAGVVIAANPAEQPDLTPTILVLIAAALWAWSNILVRQVMAHETTFTQMLFSNATFAVMAGVTMPFLWTTPDAFAWALMIGLGILSGVGQFLLFEGFRLAPASAIAPCEYTGLIFAFMLGYAIWGDVPATEVFIGAALIVLGSLVLILSEHRRARRQRDAGEPVSPIDVPVRPSIKPLDVKPDE
jgi:S-adenosylmethionine uptake transporter